jgi:hypothetical protein
MNLVTIQLGGGEEICLETDEPIFVALFTAAKEKLPEKVTMILTSNLYIKLSKFLSN